MLTVFDAVFIVSFILMFFHFHASTRRRMLMIKFISALLFAVYMWSQHAESAMIAALIASLGAFTQAICPDHMLKKTKVLRISLALALASFAIIISASTATEALPLVAVILARLVETQSDQQKIRCGVVMPQLCWFTYALQQGLWLVLISETINILSNFYAIWRHEQNLKKAVLVRT